MNTRAKVTCSEVAKRKSSYWDSAAQRSVDGFTYTAKFYPVTGDTPENKSFFASTPSGSIELSTIREDHFVPGQTYYIDFTPAEA